MKNIFGCIIMLRDVICFMLKNGRFKIIVFLVVLGDFDRS